MITESDLRAVLTEEARDISEPDDVLARLTITHRPQRRRWIAPVAAAAAVAAVVATATAVVHTRHDAAPPGNQHTLPPVPGRELRFAVSIGSIAGYDVDNRYLVTGRDAADVEKSGNQGVGGEIVAYAPGRYDPATVQRGRPVNVQGRRGYFADATASADEVDKVPNKHQVPTLAWEFAPNQWVTVQGWDPAASPQMRKLHLDALTEEMRVAAAIDTTVSAPLLLPYRVGYLPGGLRHGGGRVTDMATPAPPTWDSTLWFLGSRQGDTDSDPALSILVRPYSAFGSKGFHGTFTVNGHPATFDTVETWTFSVPPSAPKPTPTTPAGSTPPRTSTIQSSPTVGVSPSEPPQLTVDFGPAVVVIAGNYARGELIKIAESLTLASNVNDRSTWFDATK
jgi:hypothetical protein